MTTDHEPAPRHHDMRLAVAEDLEAERRRRGLRSCDLCGQPLPPGLDRPYCLDHSEYAQSLIQSSP